MKKFFLSLFLILSTIISAQKTNLVNLEWATVSNYEESSILTPFFKNGFSLDKDLNMVFYSKSIPTASELNTSAFSILDVKYESIDKSELGDLNVDLLKNDFSFEVETGMARDDFRLFYRFCPIVRSGSGFKKIISFSYSLDYSKQNKTALQPFGVNTIQNSVLAQGNWHRFYIEKSGIYKISKPFLSSLGVNVNGDPRQIKIYGNGGRMLPLSNALDYPLDLEENAVLFVGEEDDVFNDSDYILMYCEGVDTWNTESLTSVNLYDDKSYYYVLAEGANGKRIQEANQPIASSTLNFSTYDKTTYYEKDLFNPGKLGRRWFGESFGFTPEQSFALDLPNLIVSEPVNVRLNFASQSYGNSSFSVSANGQNLGNVTFSAITATSGVLGFESQLETTALFSNSQITFNLSYNNGGVPNSNGYLDFIELKSKHNLNANGTSFLFFNSEEGSNVGVGEWTIGNAQSVSYVFDVTDRFNVAKYTNSGTSQFSFKSNLGAQKLYYAVDGNDFLSPIKPQQSVVNNQNLKGSIFINSQGAFQDVDYLIITPAFLYSQAENLAQIHRNQSGMSVKVVALENIYNEFSSGKQDVAAIRNFIKYVYDNASDVSKRVKYVNLFGDASYDYKNRIANNTNIVPVFHGFTPNAGQNISSNFSLFGTFMSDDFYGLMDDNEGTMTNFSDNIDIAVGRMLVSSVSQAQEMVNKVSQYYAKESYGRWRNNYVIYSDDADSTGDSFLQADLNTLADDLVAAKPTINVKKILTDSYVQEVAAGGERYPEAKQEFLDYFNIGALVFNYYGHGNEEFLASERLFEKAEAENLSNQYKYPLFITITCEFTRFDDPGRQTGGESMYWNPSGGAIGLIATTRQIGQSVGLNMNSIFSEELFSFGSSEYPTIAEALRVTKINTGSSNRRVVFYIGDPALQLAIPKPKVVLTAVNDIPLSGAIPNFEALAPIKISGMLTDENDQLLSDYNGDVAIQIFDKQINRSTLGNDGTQIGGSTVILNFNTLGETIFRGNATVNNGLFELNFVVPQDIKIPLGNGKISFYAKSEMPILKDNTGYSTAISVGGVNQNAPTDDTAPTVQLYMNDTNFVSGGKTNDSPIFLAFLQDEHGINTASGIGHDIVAILDGDETKPYILNDYYETELDDFTNGKVSFPFKNLEIGLHTLTFKAWDVYNNLVTSEIQFIVTSGDSVALTNVLNYPNPMSSYTEFWFNHNRPFEALDVQVQILTVSGKLVKTINQQVLTTGFLSREITWDGKDDFGSKIGKGVYIYKLTVREASTGHTSHKYEKLVLL